MLESRCRLVRYAFTEAGIIGCCCGTPRLSDDLHFLSDYAVNCLAMLQRGSQVPVRSVAESSVLRGPKWVGPHDTVPSGDGCRHEMFGRRRRLRRTPYRLRAAAGGTRHTSWV